MFLRRINALSVSFFFISVFCTSIHVTKTVTTTTTTTTTKTLLKERKFSTGDPPPERAPEFKLTAKNFFMAPAADYIAAKDYCHENGGEPFVPKTKLELLFLGYKVSRKSKRGWLPLTDIHIEGCLQWDDRTEHNDDLVEMNNPPWTGYNNEDKNCVAVDENGSGFWSYCFFENPLLCIKYSAK